MENAGSTVNKKTFALIGGIASGKTAISDILGEMGAYIIDADIISRSVTAPGSKGEKLLAKKFPDCVEGGVISRKLLKNKVFGDDKALASLNKITHPLILAEIDRMVSEANGTAVVVMPIPLHLEKYDAVISVYCPTEMRIERIIKRDNISRELAEKIIAAQLTDQQVAARSDFTFVNDGDREALRRAVTKWWNIFVESKE
ncbi:MAG: dephospho-CoA kinase [Clostridia bacterium]|nr:dephospho-CoA kinase [Clostridia bacterium]